MIDDKDIQKLKEVFATKDELKAVRTTLDDFKETALEIFATKADVRRSAEDVIQATREMLQGYLNRSDKEVQKIDILESEYTAHGFQLDRHERWIGTLAGKAGVLLKQD